jgi:SPASM domain peptide maturase of grasp-with-spasm system
MICDLQNQRGQLIPNDLFLILTAMSSLPIDEIKARFEHESDSVIDQYFSMLVEKNFGFWCDEPEYFRDLDLSWRKPGVVTNAIIDVDQKSRHDYKSLFYQLDALGCQAVQVRAYDPLSLESLAHIVAASEGLSLRHLDLVVKFHPELTEEQLKTLCLEHHVISRIVVHSCPFEKRAVVHPYAIILNFDKQSVTPSSCGHVSPDYFSITLDHFTEAHHFNTCLNRKIGICADGEIKNCPSMKQSYGNAGDVALSAAAQRLSMAEATRITKDQVSVCKDCEFRYICTDCRAYVSSPDDPYSKPVKCSYDPYTATWNDSQLVSISV